MIQFIYGGICAAQQTLSCLKNTSLKYATAPKQITSIPGNQHSIEALLSNLQLWRHGYNRIQNRKKDLVWQGQEFLLVQLFMT